MDIKHRRLTRPMPGCSSSSPPRSSLLNTRLSITSLWVLSACATSPTQALHEPQHQPLYQQLGGEAGIEAIVQKTLTRVSQAPHTQHSFKGIKMPYLIHSVSMHLCKVADGPCVYEGENMRKAHASSHIQASEFESMVTILREELVAAGVSTSAKNELLRRLAPMKSDVVTP